jgi:cytidylate kinase
MCSAMPRRPIIAIDGPSGAGKGTIAQTVAAHLQYRHIDTGAMYRAVAWAAVRDALGWDDPGKLAVLARRLRIEVLEYRVLLNGQDVTAAIRTPEITTVTHHAADNPDVREHLVALQRAAAMGRDVVTEGRDQGTVVFPNAECKIFLVASAEERARRRVEDFRRRGQQVTLEEVLTQQNLRDQRDTVRKAGPLARAADAITFSTDGLTSEQVIDRLEAIVRERMSQAAPCHSERSEESRAPP